MSTLKPGIATTIGTRSPGADGGGSQAAGAISSSSNLGKQA